MKCRPSSARPETPVLRKLKWKVKVVHEKVVAIERNTVKRGKIVLSPNKCRNKEIYENIKAKMDKISNYAVKDAKCTVIFSTLCPFQTEHMSEFCIYKPCLILKFYSLSVTFY